MNNHQLSVVTTFISMNNDQLSIVTKFKSFVGACCLEVKLEIRTFFDLVWFYNFPIVFLPPFEPF